MDSGKRITVALVGLVLLAVIGWFAKDVTSHRAQDTHGGTTPVSTAPVSPSAPRPAGASG